jgi:prepilin-type N-terminal cleavage/methylation domain-containing protein
MNLNHLKATNTYLFNTKSLKSIYKTKKSSKGMTALELMTVVVIIGILVSLVGVNFIKSSTRRANEASLQSNMRTLQVMLETYKVDWQAYPVDLNALSVESDQKKYNKTIANPFTKLKGAIDSNNIWAVDFIDPTSGPFLANPKIYEGKVGYQYISELKYYLIGYGEGGFPIEKNGTTYLVTNG